MKNMTKCWNLQVDTINNNKYKFLSKLSMFFNLWKDGYKISQQRLLHERDKAIQYSPNHIFMHSFKQARVAQDATMDALLLMVEQSSNKCLQHAIDKNQRLIGELLIKMIIESKYPINPPDINKKELNQQQCINNNDNGCQTNNSGRRRKSNTKAVNHNSETLHSNQKHKSKKQLKQLFKSLTKSTYQVSKESSNQTKTNSIPISVGINVDNNNNNTYSASNSNTSLQTQLENIRKSIASAGSIAKKTQLTSFASKCSNSNSNSFGINNISDDSLTNILVFLSPRDIHFRKNLTIFNKLHERPNKIHTVSKRFNLLLKNINNNKNIWHTIVPNRDVYRAPYHSINLNTSYQYHYNFGVGLFLTLDELYKLKHNDMNMHHKMSLEIQAPNGKICNITVKSYPWPLSSKVKNAHIVDAKFRDKLLYNYPSTYDDDAYEMEMDDINIDVKAAANNQIFYQNTEFTTNIFTPQMLTKQTLTNFLPCKCLSIRTIKYKKSKLNQILKTKNSMKYKLVDINLQGLYNHYIFNKFTWELFCGLSIGQIAIFLTKRKWIVGLVDRDKCTHSLNHPKVQIRFEIDITEEVNAIKAPPNTTTQTLIIKREKNDGMNNNKTDMAGSKFSDATIKKSNVNMETHNNTARYYGEFYTRPDDSCIIAIFGSHTNNIQHQNVYKRYYPRLGNAHALLNFKPVQMYSCNTLG